MDKSDQVLGIDFGTSNSYFCKYHVVNVDNLKIREFEIEDEDRLEIEQMLEHLGIDKMN